MLHKLAEIGRGLMRYYTEGQADQKRRLKSRNVSKIDPKKSDKTSNPSQTANTPSPTTSNFPPKTNIPPQVPTVPGHHDDPAGLFQGALRAGFSALLIPIATLPFDLKNYRKVLGGNFNLRWFLKPQTFLAVYPSNVVMSFMTTGGIFVLNPPIKKLLKEYDVGPECYRPVIAKTLSATIQGALFSPLTIVKINMYTEGAAKAAPKGGLPAEPAKCLNFRTAFEMLRNLPPHERNTKLGIAFVLGPSKNAVLWCGSSIVYPKIHGLMKNETDGEVMKDLKVSAAGAVSGVSGALCSYPIDLYERSRLKSTNGDHWRAMTAAALKEGLFSRATVYWKGFFSGAVLSVPFRMAAVAVAVHKADDIFHAKKGMLKKG